MRLAMRALIYLALPSVAFAWLLQVDFPARPGIGLDPGFGGIYSSDTLAHLADAAGNAAIGVGVVALIVAIVRLFGVGSHPPQGERIKR